MYVRLFTRASSSRNSVICSAVCSCPEYLAYCVAPATARVGCILFASRGLSATGDPNEVVIQVVYNGCWCVGGSVAEWLACWTHAQKGPGSNRSRDAVG